MSRDAIDPSDFIHPYGEQSVMRDLATVERLRTKFETTDPHKKYADVLESILYEHIEQSNWFGESATTIKTSHYDDIINGIDLIVEFEEASKSLSHLGLAVDITFGTTSMQKKFQTIRSEIEAGTLAEVKYFESERSPHKGLYQKLPRVVIGAEREHVIKLAAMWLDPKRKKEFSDHPIQKVILTEISTQLQQFKEYAASVNRQELVPIFDRQLGIIRKILSSKSRISTEDYKEDKVVEAIRSQLELF